MITSLTQDSSNNIVFKFKAFAITGQTEVYLTVIVKHCTGTCPSVVSTICVQVTLSYPRLGNLDISVEANIWYQPCKTIVWAEKNYAAEEITPVHPG